MLLFLCLVVFLSADLSVETNRSSEQCSACDLREHSKQTRLHGIKSQILSILRLEQAANISRDVVRQLLPKAPPLTQLPERYDPRVEEEEEEAHATTETIITMASERETVTIFTLKVKLIYGTSFDLVMTSSS
ncbi:growth/differentiation factor 8-like isoform 2-T2 [Spinachia spinachia]